MNIGDLVFYVLDAVVLVMLGKMLMDSQKVEIETRLGPRWVIPVLFWGIAAMSAFNYTGMFRIIQTSVLILMGILYWFMKSGLAPEGVVMIGRFFKYENCTPIEIDDEFNSVKLTVRRSPTEIRFPDEDMNTIRKYLSEHAGTAFKEYHPKKS